MLGSKLRQLFRWTPPPKFDPSSLQDDVALRTDWDPIPTDVGNFDLWRLVREENSAVRYKRTFGGLCFCWAFILMGSVFCAMVIVWFPSLWEGPLIPIIIGLVLPPSFIVLGIWLLLGSARSITFDPQKSMLTYRKTPWDLYMEISFSEIHALQFLQNPSEYDTYQINIIWQNGDRRNICHYSSVKNAERDIQTLSDMIGCKIWDAVTR